MWGSRGRARSPRWFRKKEVPYDKMWEDDRYWMPIVLDGGIYGGFEFERWRLRNWRLYLLEETRQPLLDLV